LQETQTKVFSQTDMAVLELILHTFNDKDPFTLSEYSHSFPEWKRFEEKIKEKTKPNGFKVKMSDFFENVVEESSLFNDDEELLALTSELYKECYC
jgi:hypothetical protein